MIYTPLQCNSFKIEETVKWLDHIAKCWKPFKDMSVVAGSLSNLGLSILSSDWILFLLILGDQIGF